MANEAPAGGGAPAPIKTLPYVGRHNAVCHALPKATARRGGAVPTTVTESKPAPVNTGPRTLGELAKKLTESARPPVGRGLFVGGNSAAVAAAALRRNASK